MMADYVWGRGGMRSIVINISVGRRGYLTEWQKHGRQPFGPVSVASEEHLCHDTMSNNCSTPPLGLFGPRIYGDEAMTFCTW